METPALIPRPERTLTLPEDAIASVSQMRAMRNGASRYSIIARDEKGAPTMNDEPVRAYYREWSRMMGRPIHNPFNER